MRRLLKYINLLLRWRGRYISDKNFVYAVSILVGVAAGLAAVFLKNSVHFVQHYLEKDTYLENYHQVLYPLLGLMITITLAKFLYKEQLGHAITDILYSISRKSSILSKGKMYSRLVTSIFTVGFGGSAGLESPIVLSGAAIGSNIGSLMRLGYKNRTLMIACGTAGVVSAMFNAPVAGLIFSFEVILVDVTVSSFIPLLLASVSATLVSILIVGDDVLFSFKLVDEFNTSDVPYYILLGIAAGFISKYFTSLIHYFEDKAANIKNEYKKGLIGGGMLVLLIFLVPPVYGEGYKTIMAMLNGEDGEIVRRSLFFADHQDSWYFLIFVLLIIIVKPIASSVTVSYGGSGGTFAPSLFVGGAVGFAFARFFNLLGFAQLSESNFALVGMCGVMSGVQYAPLTAIFLIAEITGGYELFIPLMIASAIAYSTTAYFEPYSMYLQDLIKRGDLNKHNPDRKVLEQIDINSLIEKDIKTISPEAYLKDLTKLISESKRNVFAVVSKGKLLGIITLDKVREMMFDVEKQNTIEVITVMEKIPDAIELGENMENVMLKFDRSEAWNLPVLDKGKYVGFVSKSRIFTAYRTKLMNQHDKESAIV